MARMLSNRNVRAALARVLASTMAAAGTLAYVACGLFARLDRELWQRPIT